jgi:hypothetical protein
MACHAAAQGRAPTSRSRTASTVAPPVPFRLPNVLVAPQMIHKLLSIHQFTADNSCSVEFDPSGYHTCFSKENQVQTYMHARIMFHAYSRHK